jgi:hypothetical protein
MVREKPYHVDITNTAFLKESAQSVWRPAKI